MIRKRLTETGHLPPADRVNEYKVTMIIEHVGHIMVRLWAYYKDGTKEIIAGVTKNIYIRDINLFIRKLIQVLPHEIYYRGKRVDKFVVEVLTSEKEEKFAHVWVDYTTSSGRNIGGEAELYNPKILIKRCEVIVSSHYFSVSNKAIISSDEKSAIFEITEKDLDTLFSNAGVSGEKDVKLFFSVVITYALNFGYKFKGWDFTGPVPTLIKTEVTSVSMPLGVENIPLSIPIHVKLATTVEKKPFKIRVNIFPAYGKLEFQREY